MYECKSGNHLGITMSETSDGYQHYVCKEHVNCSFAIVIGRRRGDGMFSVKRLVARHCGERLNARARNGWAWKNRAPENWIT